MTQHAHTLVYTLTDEAPALATHSWLPMVRGILAKGDIAVDLQDISLAGRILAYFPTCLSDEQKQSDALTYLGELAKTPDANIIKLPNISASIPQLTAAIAELQQQGYAIPDYPAQPQNETEQAIQDTYVKVLGSAVNPVLREGNSDRRAPVAVKNYAKANPHRMGAWSPDSKTCVRHMNDGDFFGSEVSTTIAEATEFDIVFTGEDGQTQTLKSNIPLQAGEILDAAVMSQSALLQFLKDCVAQAKDEGILFSLHLKATMMKVSDPIIFGQAVLAYFAPLFEAHPELMNDLGVNPNNGFGDVVAKLDCLDEDQRQVIQRKIAEVMATQADLAMVDSDKGITNLHVPSDVIIDASMPAMIRASGQMWNAQGQQQDTLCVIPDRCYAGVYAETIAFCKTHGAFDPTTMGSVANVGLMAQKAEEYGSHDKTFQATGAGTMAAIDAQGQVLLKQTVQAGDIFRMCQVKDAPIRDWVQLAVRRARSTGSAAVFWLNEQRAHDREMLAKVTTYLGEENTDGLDIRILSPEAATRFTLTQIKAGQDVISVTGNVLRDYLTDLFPILELGTSAKMLSIVPLMNGGGLFETGAGGSAPKHVQQLVQENHLRWDSLGEFLALAVSLEHLAEVKHHPAAKILAKALDQATEQLLNQNQSPSRQVGELDNRGSHFYLFKHWVQALAMQQDDQNLAKQFENLAKLLLDKEMIIVQELIDCQGKNVDLGGYYHPDSEKVNQVMRPSGTLNALVGAL